LDTTRGDASTDPGTPAGVGNFACSAGIREQHAILCEGQLSPMLRVKPAFPDITAEFTSKRPISLEGRLGGLLDTRLITKPKTSGADAHLSRFGFATPLWHPSETSNPRSIFIQKRNCRCCLQRIRERMRRRCSEPDSLIADRIAVFRPNARQGLQKALYSSPGARLLGQEGCQPAGGSAASSPTVAITTAKLRNGRRRRSAGESSS
jgi:hypothetical protein